MAITKLHTKALERKKKDEFTEDYSVYLYICLLVSSQIFLGSYTLFRMFRMHFAYN